MAHTVATATAPGRADSTLLPVPPAAGDGPAFAAVDAVGAGVGDVVLVATGSAVRELDGLQGVAADAAIVAIVDDRP